MVILLWGGAQAAGAISLTSRGTAPALMEHRVTPQALILRCQPSRTLEIYKRFEKDRPGLLWTPLLIRTMRLPRRRKKVRRVNAAIPGYLFLRGKELERSLALLAQLKARPVQVGGMGYARCPITELEVLRDTVQGVVRRLSAPDQDLAAPFFAPGTIVQVAADHYWMAGLIGEVIKQQGEEVTIKSANFWGTIKISCWILSPAAL